MERLGRKTEEPPFPQRDKLDLSASRTISNLSGVLQDALRLSQDSRKAYLRAQLPQ